MAIPGDFPFIRYLSAKKSVDDRSLNRTVWQELTGAVSSRGEDEPLRVLEIGGGIGTMIARTADWGLLKRAECTVLDAMPENIAHAGSYLRAWADRSGYRFEQGDPSEIRLTATDREIMVKLETGDVFHFLSDRGNEPGWDLLIANAFLDLVDVPSALPDLLSLLRPKGLFYFTINFDGTTIFEPEIDPALDEQIQALYHRTMDERIIQGRPSGDSRTGRHLFEYIRRAGAELLAAGASDWVVFAGADGYPEDEEFFLHFIVHTVGCALENHPELDSKRFEQWLHERHDQVERRILVYIAHQMDFVGRVR